MYSIKLKLENPPDMEKYFREFGALKRTAYNRLKDGLDFSDTRRWVTKTIKTCLGSKFIYSAAREAQALIKLQKDKSKEIVFGGRNNFKRLSQGKITKEDWLKFRNPSLMCVGSCGDKGNSKFKSDIANKRFIFRPTKDISIELNFVARLRTLKTLEEIEQKANDKLLPITYQLTRTHIILIVNEEKLAKKISIINNRILAIDLNPNYIGISISDFKNGGQKEVFSQIFNLIKLNKLSTNKKRSEQLEISKRIIELCKHYQVETLAIEKLSVKSKNYEKGKIYNKLINSWDRQVIYKNLKKSCGLIGVNFQQTLSQYSSFIGSLQYPNKIDSISATLELARRADLFKKVYIDKILPKETSIIFPHFDNQLLNRWKEEAGALELSNWKTAFNWFKKNPKLCYRILYASKTRKVFRFKSRKTNVFLYFG